VAEGLGIEKKRQESKEKIGNKEVPVVADDVPQPGVHSPNSVNNSENKNIFYGVRDCDVDDEEEYKHANHGPD
jgi:hypothetical protein